MANRKISELRADTFQSMKDLQAGKITIDEANVLSEQAGIEIKAYNKRISEVKKGLKDEKSRIIDVTVIEPLKLNTEDMQLAKTIKEKLRKTAETIVEIGESISKAIIGKEKEYRDLFYETIGMSSRSAQRYMQIANHVKIQELKSANQLEGKTMTDLLSIMSPKQQESSKTINVSEVANNFYNRYKNNPVELENIMNELQRLIDSSVQK